MSSITAIVLTYNEERHINRCIESLKRVAEKIYVVDSFSTDKTCEIASACGATVVQHKYQNQAQQFQWALDNCPVETEWTIRLDADEYLTEGFIEEIAARIDRLPASINGVWMKRRVRFLGKTLRFGSLKPICLLRLWRTGTAYMEQRWMDEQMVLKKGDSVTFDSWFVDDNLNGLTAWTQKHNDYSNREIVVELDKKYNLFSAGETLELTGRNNRRGFYYKLPRFFRALAYFTLRYIIFLGFLDGVPGLVWLTLQSYWYRFLVDSKMYEMEKQLGKNPSRDAVIEYVRRFYNIDIPA